MCGAPCRRTHPHCRPRPTFVSLFVCWLHRVSCDPNGSMVIPCDMTLWLYHYMHAMQMLEKKPAKSSERETKCMWMKPISWILSPKQCSQRPYLVLRAPKPEQCRAVYKHCHSFLFAFVKRNLFVVLLSFHLESRARVRTTAAIAAATSEPTPAMTTWQSERNIKTKLKYLYVRRLHRTNK